MDKGFSIILCCYNSSELLRETIRSICNLNSGNGFKAELIVIDNASTDKTSETAENYLKEFNCPITYRIEQETVPGLSNARKKGIELSRFEYIVFCDDDNHLSENYLNNAFGIIEKDLEIGALGGISIPVSDKEFPEWFDDFKQSYSVGRQSDISGEIKSHMHSLWGAGLILRKTAVKELYDNGFHSLLTDRTGNKLSSGGDSELCFALRLAGWKIWFDDNLVLEHFLPEKRLSWKYLRELNRGFGRQKVSFDAYLNNFSIDENELNDIDWKKRFYTMVKKMRSYGFRKILSFKNLNKGDPEIIRMEKTIGSLQELLKLKEEYGNRILETGKSKWISQK